MAETAFWLAIMLGSGVIAVFSLIDSWLYYRIVMCNFVGEK